MRKRKFKYPKWFNKHLQHIDNVRLPDSFTSYDEFSELSNNAVWVSGPLLKIYKLLTKKDRKGFIDSVAGPLASNATKTKQKLDLAHPDGNANWHQNIRGSVDSIPILIGTSVTRFDGKIKILHKITFNDAAMGAVKFDLDAAVNRTVSEELFGKPIRKRFVKRDNPPKD